MKNTLKRVYLKFQSIVSTVLPRYFLWSPWGSSLYYLLFRPKFRRENYAVLHGKVKHLHERKKGKTNFYTLIRNVHRIEKGLIMRPRKDIFGLNYIKETVDIFDVLYNKNKNSCSDGSQLKWAKDVLNEYFVITGKHPVINKERERFYTIISNFGDSPNKSIPYYRLEENKPKISYDEFYKLARHRRSVRWFLDKKVPRELIDKAILVANQSPSACNRQPFEYRIIDDPNLLKEVVKIPAGIKGYEDNIPMLIVVVGNLDAYFDERDRHIIYIDASLANMAFMFSLETLGLSSCSINWPDIEKLEKRMEKSLKLKQHQRPIMCMAVGYPDPNGLVPYSEKRNIREIRKYN